MSHPPSIVVVDDDPLFRWALSEVLEGAGYRIHPAATGEDGLAAIRDCRPGVVILDIGLPDLHGFRVLEAIHQVQPDLPVLMVTADPRPEARQQALRLGAYAHFEKPCDWAALLATVSQALQSCTPPRQTGE